MHQSPPPRDEALVTYYTARAFEYEEVYAKPERQEDLRRLHEIVSSYLAGRRVLDVACGTGYWARTIAMKASAVTGCDLSERVLALARARQPVTNPVDFVVGDAFALQLVAGMFDAAFVGFWWSHLARTDLPRFLDGLHRRLLGGSRVLVLDNRYVHGSNWPVTRTDTDGNTYQRRQLRDGTEHEVLKNFPSPDEVRAAVASAGGRRLTVCELPHYWYATYELGHDA